MDEPLIDGPRAPDCAPHPPALRVTGLKGVLFWLSSDDLAALREQLLAAGIDVGGIEDGTPGPREQMELADPDGYVLKIAQNEPADA